MINKKDSIPRVSISENAIDILKKVKEEHGLVMFHISGGCCDGSSPMCLSEGELFVGEQDLYLGLVEDCGVYIAKTTFRYYENMYIHIDAVEGRGASFSLEIPLGYRFILASSLIDDTDLDKVQKPMNC
ncbi:MAG: DUF779 domain-containing protein [Alphaproteobacteria bacterium]